ncbi:MAG: hypothetical protein DME45_01870 [Verrucomicrobia bacterium]|nr:MAG: hypothetical protein DME45_01870 [Verrucomicrobiota bacterium]
MIYPPIQLSNSSIPGKIRTDCHSGCRGNRALSLVAIILLAVCFSVFTGPEAFGVNPAPDGGYPGGNTAEGTDALLSLSSGTNNTAIGADALANNVSGNDNTAVGFQALLLATGNHNTAVGSETLFFDTSGHDNTAVGFQALLNNTTGILNTAIGAFSLSANIDGRFNTAVGGGMEKNTGGSSNVAVGLAALDSNTTGSGNTATGINALFFNQTGSNNAATGGNALLNNTGNNNAATGAFALQGNTGGHDNSAQGFQALKGNTTGNNNVGIGSNAGANVTTGSNNIDIGANVVGNASDSGKIRIGKQGTQNGTFIAGIFGVAMTGSPVVVSSNGKLGVNGTSSARFKAAIKPMDKASEVILALKPVTFRYKEEIDPDGIPQFGLVAEEVEKVNRDLITRDEDGKPTTVRYEAVNAMLLNEFLKEHRKVEEQQATIMRLESKIAKQELIATQQQKQIEGLSAAIQKVSERAELGKPAPQLVANP